MDHYAGTMDVLRKDTLAVLASKTYAKGPE